MKVVLFHHLQNKSAASVARDVCNALYRNGIAVWADPCCRKLNRIVHLSGNCRLCLELRFY